MEIIHPATEAEWLKLRTHDITSTEVAILFGCSPYMSSFELWHSKASGVSLPFEATERTEWGLALQDAIASKIASKQGWDIRHMSEYIRDPNLRIGSSFDFAIEPEGLLEIKNVDSLQFSRGWLVDGDNIEAPPHIELQVQHQLLVSGKKYAWLGALVGGNKLILIRREPIQPIQEAILAKAAEFWQTIDADIEPSPVYPADADAVIRLQQYAEPGKIIAGTEELAGLAIEYRDLKRGLKSLDEQADTIKAKILTLIGDAEKVKGDEYTISAGITGEADISFTRKAFRNFRISWKGAK